MLKDSIIMYDLIKKLGGVGLQEVVALEILIETEIIFRFGIHNYLHAYNYENVQCRTDMIK